MVHSSSRSAIGNSLAHIRLEFEDQHVLKYRSLIERDQNFHVGSSGIMNELYAHPSSEHLCLRFSWAD